MKICRIWSRHTFKLCESLWRQESLPELEGLGQLAEAVALMPAYDLFDDLEADQNDGESWKDIVYDYRWLTTKETTALGFSRGT